MESLTQFRKHPSEILSDSSFIHVDLSHPSLRRFKAQRDGEGGSEVTAKGERRRKQERSESTLHFGRRLFSRDRFLALFDRTRVILSQSDNDTGDISDTVLTSLGGRSRFRLIPES